VNPRPAPPLPLFAAVSFGLHLAAAMAVHRAGASPKPVFQSEAQTLSGDTLDVEPPAGAVTEQETAEQNRASTASAAARHAPSGPPGSAATHAARSSAAARSAAATAQAATFGAVGARYATDLATTFTRAFPQAGSADPIWSTAPFGAAGSAEVVLVLDEEGRLSGSTILGAPSPALRRGIERTLAILGPRVFTASSPSTRLRVAARVGRDEVHDGLHGDVFALSGGSFSADVGTAFFALPPEAGPGSEAGRRVDIEIRLLP